MEGRFSFLGDELESIFSIPGLSLPGVEKITGIYFSEISKDLRMISINMGMESTEEAAEMLENPEQAMTIQRQRSTSLPYTWISKGELPFDVADSPGMDHNLFSELENLVLVLRYKNEFDGKYDLLYLEVDPNPGSFGIRKDEKGLTSEYKNIIGHLFYYYFKNIFNFSRQNKAFWTRLSQTVRALVRENLQIKEESVQTNANYGDSMVNLCQQYLQELSERHNRQYILSGEAAEKIRTFKGNIRHLDAIIRNAVLFTDNIMMTGDAEIISIEAFSLNFDEYQATPVPEESIRKIDSRESRTIQLLDKLEKGATILKAKNVSLTSVNVGKALPQPISAPAITDALKKHRRMILMLLGKFPEKWEVIRNDFKPLRNIMKEDREIGQAEADTG